MKKSLLVIAQQGYQDREYAGTRAALVGGGVDIEVASTEAGACLGKLGGTETAAKALRDVTVTAYDAVVFIGGPGAEALASDAHALSVARAAVEANILLGAICIAPLSLAKARVLDGRKATVWDSGGEQAALLERYGAQYTGDSVTVDGRIVTANGAGATDEFARSLLALI